MTKDEAVAWLRDQQDPIAQQIAEWIGRDTFWIRDLLDNGIPTEESIRSLYGKMGIKPWWEHPESAASQPAGNAVAGIPAWKCKARASNMGPNDPQECNWPLCDCDPYAEKVIASLQECGVMKDKTPPKFEPIQPIPATNPVARGMRQLEAERIAAWLDSNDATYSAALIRRYYVTGIGNASSG